MCCPVHHPGHEIPSYSLLCWLIFERHWSVVVTCKLQDGQRLKDDASSISLHWTLQASLKFGLISLYAQVRFSHHHVCRNCAVTYAESTLEKGLALVLLVGLLAVIVKVLWDFKQQGLGLQRKPGQATSQDSGSEGSHDSHLD